MSQHELSIIFIVGSSRSGTTMFNRILGNHPDILALNELHYIGNHWDVESNDTWHKEKAMFQSATLLAVARRSIWDARPTKLEMEEAKNLFAQDGYKDKYKPAEVLGRTLEFLLKSAKKKTATDQTPRNILYVDHILQSFPDARVIQLIRDPRAVLFSQKNRWRQRSLGAKGTPLWNALRVYANYHVYTVTKLWLAAYMKGENVVNNENYMRLRFEDLASDPQRSLKEVCKFLDVGFHSDMMDVPRVGSSNLEHREDVRGISADVIDAWKGKLSDAELWLCERMAEEAMLDMGYKTNNVNVPWLGLLGQLMLYPLHIIGVLLTNPRLAFRIVKVMRNR